MKLVFELRDIEEKLTAILRMEGLDVENLSWQGVEGPVELHMDFKTLPAAETPQPAVTTPDHVQQVMDALQELREVAVAKQQEPTPPAVKARKPRKPRKPKLPVEDAGGPTEMQQVLHASNAITMNHPITNAPVRRPLANNESTDYPGEGRGV